MATFVRTQSISHRIGGRGRLVLRVHGADMSINGVRGDEASLRATFEIRADSDEEADRIFEEARLHTEAGGSQLLVEERDNVPNIGAAISRLISGRGQLALSIEVEVPSLVELRVESAAADVRADGLQGDQRYESVSGDLYLTDVGGTIRVNTVSGDVTIRATDRLDVQVEAVSADLSVIAPRLDGVRATTVSGDIEVEGELGKGEYRAETVSGDLTVGLVGGASFEVRGLSTDIHSDLDHRIEGRDDRRRVVIGGGGPAFSFSSMSGDLAVRRPRRVDAGFPRAHVESPDASPTPRPSAGEQLAVLRALEAGEIDVDEAARRLGNRSDA
jgi:DUF4097 and DUF4098 domain-containing protein YvlB